MYIISSHRWAQKGSLLLAMLWLSPIHSYKIYMYTPRQYCCTRAIYMATFVFITYFLSLMNICPCICCMLLVAICIKSLYFNIEKILHHLGMQIWHESQSWPSTHFLLLRDVGMRLHSWVMARMSMCNCMQTECGTDCFNMVCSSYFIQAEVTVNLGRRAEEN